MTFPEIVMIGVVAVVGVPAYRNPTAAALVVAWVGGQVIYLITGDNLPVQYYPFPDIFVVAVIMAKREYRSCRPYRGTWHQFKCLLLERSPADRAVILAFVVCWIFYVAPIHDFYRWWVLWSLTILQFLFASAESLEMFWRRLAVRKSVTPIIDRHLVVVPFQRREADAVRTTPDFSGALLTVNGGGGSG